MIAPVSRTPVVVPPAAAKVARDFEALFIAQMLRSAHAAALADDPLAGKDTGFRDMQDQQLAASIAAQSPLGVVRLLALRK